MVRGQEAGRRRFRVGGRAVCRTVGVVAGAGIAFSCALFPSGGAAQSLPQSPPVLPTAPSVQPAPQLGPAPRALPPILPAAPGAQAPSGAEGVRFRLNQFQIDGATVYPPETLLAPHQSLFGQEIAAAKVWAVARQIENRYRDAGYILTRVIVPEQEVSDGIVRLRVIEGAVDRVLIEGEIGPAEVLIHAFLSNITQSRPLNSSDLERWVLLAGDVPGIVVQTVLRAGQGGGTELVARVARKAYDGVISLDDRGSKYIGPRMLSGAFGLNALTNFGERSEISYAQAGFHPFPDSETGRPREQYFVRGALEGFLGTSGLKLRVYAGGGRTEPGDFLRRTGYFAETVVAGAELRYPIFRTRRFDLNASVAFDLSDSVIRVADITEPGKSVTNSNDTLRVWRAGLAARYDDDWGGVSRLSGLVHKGVNWYAQPQPAARPGQINDFIKWTGEASRRQALFTLPEFEIHLLASASGQWTSQVLPNPEKFFLGGTRAGRGYYFGQVTGDIGYAASAELQLTIPWDLEVGAFVGGPWTGQFQLYVFRDHATAIDHGIDALPRRAVRSSGLGLRVDIDGALQLELEAVRRDVTRPNTPNEEPLDRNVIYGKATIRF